MAFLDELAARGLFADVTDREGLAELLVKEAPVNAYAGFDPTSPSLHVGNLVPVIMLKRLQLAGHRPIIVVGGATGMVGDPSGKSEERNLLDDGTLQLNVAGIRAQLSRLLDFDDPTTGAIMTNNADWTRGVSYLEFLRDIGKYLTINYMMAKDSVKSRLENENGISYTEFSYMLLQAFDFVELHKKHGCRLQVGGSDQYGNITAGCELSRKMGRAQLYGLVAPLLLDSTGQKMGKTSTGERIWLDGARTCAFDFYNYWMKVTDEDVGRFLKMFSLKPVAELDEILKAHDVNRAPRIAQKELARAMTSWVHGDIAVTRVESANRVFATGTLDGFTLAELAEFAETIPTFNIPKSELAAGVGIIDLLARTVAESKSAARRLITGGGAYVNNARISDVEHKVSMTSLVGDMLLLVRGGKTNYKLVRAV